MAKSAKRGQGGSAGEVSFNMTPMIDCTFLLIIFFIITSQSASEMLAKLILPKPDYCQAEGTDTSETPNRVIVNILSAEAEEDKEFKGVAMPGQASKYKIAGEVIDVGDVVHLTEIITRYKQNWEKSCAKYGAKKEDFFIEIRSDKRVRYRDVEPVLAAAGDANLVKMKLSAEVAAKKPK